MTDTPAHVYVETIDREYFSVRDDLMPVQQPGPDAYAFSPFYLRGFAELGAQDNVQCFARQEVAGRLLRSYQAMGQWGIFSMAGFARTHLREYLHRMHVRPYPATCEHTFPFSLLRPGGMFGINETQGSWALRSAVYELIDLGVLGSTGSSDRCLCIWPSPSFMALIEPYRTR